MKCLVRVAHTADTAAVTRVLVASYPVLMAGAYNGEILAQALPLMIEANPKLLASGTFYMAEVKGEPVGCGGWTAEEPGTCRLEPGTAHLRHFAVAANWNGCGIGRALYDRCQADARNIGVRRFVCYASLNGEAFYAALGFRIVGAIEVSMGNQLTFPSIRMTREI